MDENLRKLFESVCPVCKWKKQRAKERDLIRKTGPGRERRLAIKRAYYRINREHLLKKSREWKQNNKEYYKAYMAKWRANNKDKMRMYKMNHINKKEQENLNKEVTNELLSKV